MTRRPDDLEVTFHWIAIAVVVLFSAAFAAGLVLYLVEPSNGTAVSVLNVGLLLLIASPVARITVATAERIRRRDWSFVLMVAVIALELVLVLLRAAAKA